MHRSAPLQHTTPSMGCDVLEVEPWLLLAPQKPGLHSVSDHWSCMVALRVCRLWLCDALVPLSCAATAEKLLHAQIIGELS